MVPWPQDTARHAVTPLKSWGLWGVRIAVGARMPTEPLISVAAPLGKPVGVNSLETVSGGGDAATHTDAQARRQTVRQSDSQTVRCG